ncbi:MAG: DUF2269 domain-containing protein [Proteobacteria bacterium]|nr:DUF2269 domain-containing protein [Pseudomonadota bacterium]
MELDLYPILESLHILSATILFGTGLGTAFHMWMAHKSGNVEAIAVAARTTVKADWWFTAPAIIIQLLTGIGMIIFVGFPYDLPWLVSSYVLFAIAAAAAAPKRTSASVLPLMLRLRPSPNAGLCREEAGSGRDCARAVVTIGIAIVASTWTDTMRACG